MASECIFLRDNERKKGARDPDMTGTWEDAAKPKRWAAAWWNEKDGRRYLRIIPGREIEEKDGNLHPAAANPVGNSKPMSASHRPPMSSHTSLQALVASIAASGQPIPPELLKAALEGGGAGPAQEAIDPTKDIPF